MKTFYLMVVGAVLGGVGVGVSGYSHTPTQYHIQTDEGPDRYFRFQTYTGQYRKEKRLEDGTVFGTYGWVDPNGLLRLFDYIADDDGYRIVRQRRLQVGKVNPAAYQHLADRQPWNPNYRPKGQQQSQQQSQQGHQQQSWEPTKQPQSQQQQKQQQQGQQQQQQQGQQQQQQQQQQQKPWQQQQPQKKPWQQQQQQQRPWQQQQQQQQQSASQSQTQTGGAFEGKDPADTSDMPLGGTFTINYDLGNQFHVEKLYADGRRIGRHGYVDPLGILRVSYYSSGPNGLDQRQESRWVGSRHPYTS
ncbi:hypothetical protein O3P69_006335 [Scylla paramamosain]|uniref:Uncharacterized protein n=1 Tax=Scylla paramamosain TaxID=85552 RepID=A0AAW0U1Y2_SCYPA